MKPFYYALGLIAILGAAFIGYSAMNKNKAVTQPDQKIAEIKSPEELLKKAKGVLRGQNTAPVKLMVFADYMCPGCAMYTTTIDPQVRAAYIDTGKAIEIFYDFPLGGAHVYSFLAARAARCAEDQGKFWEYHDNLFFKQRDWSYEQSPPIKTLKKYAGDLSLDRTKFDSCLDSDMHADLVTYNHQLGMEAGVNSTPTVFINGKASTSPLNWDGLKVEIDAAIGAGR